MILEAIKHCERCEEESKQSRSTGAGMVPNSDKKCTHNTRPPPVVAQTYATTLPFQSPVLLDPR
eukprot:m.96905 g.96905  ORF g.96905 m.96905 type:complete len:64 (-) comp15206_c2_seq2:571-762(-)